MDSRFAVSWIKKSFILSLTGVLLLLLSCRDDALKQIIVVKNNSAAPICILASHNFPDTTLDCHLSAIRIDPKEHTELYLKMGWEYEIERIAVLQIFVIDKDVWYTETCENIRKDYKILKRMHLNEDVLRNSGWTVAYP